MANWYVSSSTGNDSTGTGASGNPYATLGKAFSVMAAGDTVFCTGSNTVTATINPIAGNATAGLSQVVGTNASWAEDGTQFTVNCSTVGVYVFDTVNFVVFRNVAVDCSNAAARCFRFNNSSYVFLFNCLAKRFVDYGILLGAGCEATGCEVTGGTSAATTAAYLAGGTFFGGNIHGNACVGATMVNPSAALLRSLVTGNTGLTSDGVQVNIGGPESFIVTENTIHGNGRDGIRFVGNGDASSSSVKGNILTGHGGYGIRNAGTLNWNWLPFDYNAFYNNTSGPRSNVPAGANDQSLTADPYVNAASGNFALNTSGADFATKLKAKGFPGVFPAGLTTGYLDIGAVQHQDAAGGSSIVIQRPIVANTYALIG